MTTPTSAATALLALWPLLLLLAAALALANLLRLARESDPALHLLPLILLAAINGTLMSQQLWGSTYGIWPLLVLLLAEMLASLDDFDRARRRSSLVHARAGRSHLRHAAGLRRVLHLQRRAALLRAIPDGPAAHSAFPALAGMATPGPYLPEFDELLRYAQANIPFNDGLILIPGEDPFYLRHRPRAALSRAVLRSDASIPTRPQRSPRWCGRAIFAG